VEVLAGARLSARHGRPGGVQGGGHCKTWPKLQSPQKQPPGTNANRAGFASPANQRPIEFKGVCISCAGELWGEEHPIWAGTHPRAMPCRLQQQCRLRQGVVQRQGHNRWGGHLCNVGLSLVAIPKGASVTTTNLLGRGWGIYEGGVELDRKGCKSELRPCYHTKQESDSV
jgi:hypothetical protein